jgi:hypothetical protein
LVAGDAVDEGALAAGRLISCTFLGSTGSFICAGIRGRSGAFGARVSWRGSGAFRVQWRRGVAAGSGGGEWRRVFGAPDNPKNSVTALRGGRLEFSHRGPTDLRMPPALPLLYLLNSPVAAIWATSEPPSCRSER